MGCMSAKPPGAAGGSKAMDSEKVSIANQLFDQSYLSKYLLQTFLPLDTKQVYATKNDVVASHKDFVVEYEDMKIFQAKYDMTKQLG